MQRLSRADREAATLKIRGTKHKVAEFPADYQQLTHLTSTLGKDVKFHAPAEYRDTALGYARKRNLVLGPVEDVDNDQINDVVLYDYHGNPVIVNGYELKQSERPYRMKYRELYPTRVAKTAVGGYNGFKKEFHSVKGMSGWMETQPSKFARISVPKPRRAIAPSLYDYYSDEVRELMLQRIDALLAGRSHLKSTFSIFNIISVCYLKTIIVMLWEHPDNNEVVQQIIAKVPANGDLLCATHRLEMFKSYIKKNQDKIMAIVKPKIKSIVAESVNGTEKYDYLRGCLDPVLNTLKNMPTDLEFAALKIRKDTASVHQINVAKAELTEVMKDHFIRVKTQIINFHLMGLDQPDIPGENTQYGDRVKYYLDMLMSMDPTTRSKHIYQLLHYPKSTNDMMNFMSYIKDPKYTDLFEEIRAKFAAHGWLA